MSALSKSVRWDAVLVVLGALLIVGAVASVTDQAAGYVGLLLVVMGVGRYARRSGAGNGPWGGGGGGSGGGGHHGGGFGGGHGGGGH